MRTAEGTSWPIVLFAELVGARAEEWRRALEDAHIIVLYEPSVLRAAVVVEAERPSVVVLASSIASERTQAVRDAARDAGAEVLALPLDSPPDEVRMLVERRLAKLKTSKRPR